MFLLLVAGISLQAQQHQLESLPAGSDERVNAFIKEQQNGFFDPELNASYWLRIYAPGVKYVEYRVFYDGSPDFFLGLSDPGITKAPGLTHNGAPPYCWLSKVEDDNIYLDDVVLRSSKLDFAEDVTEYNDVQLHVILYYSEDLSEYDVFSVRENGKRIQSTRNIGSGRNVENELPRIVLQFVEGVPKITIIGEAGGLYAVESSPDFQGNWNLVASSQVQLSAQGKASIFDRSEGSKMRFYRLIKLSAPNQ